MRNLKSVENGMSYEMNEDGSLVGKKKVIINEELFEKIRNMELKDREKIRGEVNEDSKSRVILEFLKKGIKSFGIICNEVEYLLNGGESKKEKDEKIKERLGKELYDKVLVVEENKEKKRRKEVKEDMENLLGKELLKEIMDMKFVSCYYSEVERVEGKYIGSRK